jgi:cell shape-determining protein MreC
LINADNNKNFIIDHLISIIESSDDSGIIRRSITSIFMIDIKIAMESLLSLFPAYDIGTPKRILKWLMNNLKEIKKYAKDNEFNKNLKELINLSESYSNRPESLKEMASELKEAITKIKN